MSTTCEVCHDTGNCPECKGTGWLPTDDPDWEKECIECDGTGNCIWCELEDAT
jgi:DnaJ-class molecular chaperone